MARPKSKRVKMPNGAGSVIQRSDGRWMARYTTEDPDTGRSVRKALYGSSEQEARVKLIEALGKRQSGTLAVTSGKAATIRTYIDRWLATKQARPKTLQRYRELLEGHVAPVLGAIPVSRLEPRHVNSLLTTKQASGLSARTCNHIRAVLRNLLHDAMREGLVVRNVAELARPIPIYDVEETKVLAPDQMPVFLEAAERHPRGNLWVLALATGARQGELLGLRWEDVDLDESWIRISRTLQYLKGKWHVLPPKTRRSRRPVALPEIGCEALRRQRKQQAEMRLRSAAWSEDFPGLVFTTDQGFPLPAPELSKELRKELGEHGLPPLRFHDLRHSTASLLAFMKVPPRVAMEILGHSQISTTMDLYTKVYPELRREAAEALDRVFGVRPDGPDDEVFRPTH